MREMKDSGVEWIGEIPKDWKVSRLKYVLSEAMKYGANETGVEYSSEMPRYIRITDISLDGKLKDTGKLSLPNNVAKEYILKDKAILFARSGATVGKTFIYKSEYGKMAFAGYLISAYCNEKLFSPELLYYFTNSFAYSEWINRVFSQSTIQNIGADKYVNMILAVPKIAEQQQIVDYLDTKCSEIDATAEDIKKEISLLEDYKKSVITEAVTKGLNPDAEMKDSGIAWIGEIPKDWDLLKIGYVTKEISDIDHYMPSDSDDIDKVPYLMIGDLKENISQIDFESCKYISKKVYRALSIKSKPEKENVIFARYATIGTVCFVDSEKQLLVSYACLTVKANELIKGRFLFYYFKSNAFLEEVSQYVKSNTQGNIGKESLIRAKIVVPKLKEQTQIISYLDSKCSEIDAIIADKKRQRGILADYKKSLIYEYVTGKKEVPVHE